MADLATITLPNGSSYNFKDSSARYSIENFHEEDIKPIATKTYTDLIATENTWNNATFFYGKIVPTSYTATWSLKYKIYANVPSYASANAWATTEIYGSKSTLNAYHSFNHILSTDYRPVYYQDLYRATQAGSTTYGHLLGLSLRSSWQQTTSSRVRTITIEILQCKDCTFTFFDQMVKYANAPGTGATNYSTYSEFDFATNGLQETGDNNDPNYRNRVYYSYYKTYTNL